MIARYQLIAWAGHLYIVLRDDNICGIYMTFKIKQLIFYFNYKILSNLFHIVSYCGYQ